MEEKLEFGQCYYKPSFFNMKVDVLVELNDLREIPEGTMGLYFHEYIHFLQDISTIYGLMNMSTINYYIQSCAHNIAQDKEKMDFNVPMKLEDLKPIAENDDYGKVNFKLRKIYMGSSIREKSRAIENFSFSIERIEYEKRKEIEIVEIRFHDIDAGEEKIMQFGGVHVCEGMAYLCEHLYYKDELPKGQDYPYMIVQKITEAAFPEAVKYPVLMAVLCDIALMTYNPGLNFVRLLEYVRDELKVDEHYNFEKLYKDCMGFVKGSHVDFETLSKTVLEEIGKNFKAEYYDNTKDWIATVFTRMAKLRFEKPHFIADMLTGGEPRSNGIFAFIMGQIGSPLVIDGNYNGTISIPHGWSPDPVRFNPGMFMALSQVLKIFSSETPSVCELKEFCKKSRENDVKIIVDEDCDVAPWKKAKGENACAVGQIWHHWALKDYYPKY